MTTLTMIPTASATAALTTRSITGLVLPYGRPGYSSAGHVTAAKGSVTLPEDLSRIKLLRDHSDNPSGFQPVGYATAADDRDDGLYMTFAVSTTADGDAAIDDVRQRVRDGMSVELVETRINAGRLDAATLSAVAIVPIPAFSDARVTDFTASRKDSTMENTTASAAAPNLTEAANSLKGAAGTVTSVADSLAPTGEPAGQSPATAAHISPAMTAAMVPAGLAMPSAKDSTPATFAQVLDTLTMTHQGKSVPDSLTAALTDITRSANPAISAPEWLGELWSGVDYTREIVPLLSTKPLTRMKAVGYRWKTKPVVKDYAGDKTEIPTGPVATEAVETAAKRLATGNDIDRAYWDFGETEFLNAYFRACAESYAMVTDQKAAAFLVESASGNVTATQPDLLHAAAKARQAIKRGARVEPTAYLVHPDDMFGLFSITQLDNPAYLELLGVSPQKFVTSELATPGTLTAWAKPAVTFFELPGSPLRVQAEDIARGGRDTAVFGYWATLLHNQAGVVSVPFGTPASGGE